MASNGVKCNETSTVRAVGASDDTQGKHKAEKNKENYETETTSAIGAKLRTYDENQKTDKEQQENEHVKPKTACNGVDVEDKIQEKEMKEMNEVEALEDVTQNACSITKGDVRQDKESEDRSHIRHKAIECGVSLWPSIEWMLDTEAEVDVGQRLGTVGRLEDGNQRSMQAPCKGRLYILTREQSEKLMKDEKDDGAENAKRIVAFVEYCIHPVRNGRTCLMCLGIVDDEEGNGDMESVNVVSHGQVIRLNIEEASRLTMRDVSDWKHVQLVDVYASLLLVIGILLEKFDSDNIRRQLGAKKLSLVLDLDHTLLHAVRVADVVGDITKTDNMHFFFIPGLAQQHVVKLRPGLAEFLTELSALYDLFIYTHGTRLYAEQMVNIIDPDESYFKNRIVARTDIPDMYHKSLKLLFPSCDDSMILVLDDRIDVWKDNEGNVFLIEPYHYFKCISEINNLSGRGTAGQEVLEVKASEDKRLAQSTAVLKHVHEAFYAGHESGMRGTTAEDQMAGKGRDVKAILSAQKRAILNGCSLVFSGVFPIIGPHSHQSHYLWRLSQDLGAVPSMTLTDFPLTHLVIHPERLGTQKHVQAKKIAGVLIVTPDWIIKCAQTWSRISEQDFLADEWKAKHASKEHVDGDISVSSDEVPPKTVSATRSSLNGDEHKDQSSAAVPHATENKPVASILAHGKLSGVNRDKHVTFAKAIDDSGERVGEAGTAQKSIIARKPRVGRRSPSTGTAITRGAVSTGVVAAGGTFDFLSKIKATKREPSSIVKIKKAKDSKKAPARLISPPKDVDDAIMRLIAAEERENEKEKKRKLVSLNIKDRLFTRRDKKDDNKRTPDSDPAAARPENKRIRVTPTEPIDGAESAEDEDDELDDLEADILGDL